ncbi:hypothetical protein ATANTOWER_032230 [Ataeniobius toweri]|uniref:Uncharacterized protein n=1 Tax=Ataeniobius toweri TaxID=208326 RepID=A0ABU7BD81_9TELE|nr:hypothetical protein [Ataeniobius toweri]
MKLIRAVKHVSCLFSCTLGGTITVSTKRLIHQATCSSQDLCVKSSLKALWWEESGENADWEEIRDTFHHTGSGHQLTKPAAYLYSALYL